MNTKIRKITTLEKNRSWALFTFVILATVVGGVYWLSSDRLVSVASAQSQDPDPLWQESSSLSLNAATGEKQSWPTPKRYKAFGLNEAALTNLLAKAPLESTAGTKDQRYEITLPTPAGALARFRFVESPIMEPKLAAQFPEIKTYRGWGIDDPTATTRFAKTSSGFHALVLSSQGAFSIDRLSNDDAFTYASYYTADAGGDDSFECLSGSGGSATARADGNGTPKLEASESLLATQSANNSTGATRRTFRLAVAATVEYTQIFSSFDTAVGAITTTISDVTAIYEREFAVSFTLVSDTSIIGVNGYTSGDVDRLVDENQTKLDQVIGSSNYDIGHVFDRNGNGLSGLAQGLACDDTNKAKGASVDPGGRAFVGIVAHEIGHMFGARHSFNGDCINREVDLAYEPGSGSTIMAYPAGPCANGNDIQFKRDLYFHFSSLQAINDYLDYCGCPTTTNNSNTPPTVTPPPFGYFIPARTPFSLTASGSDADVADAANLTYAWEDLFRGSPGTPGQDRGDNPLFRSREPIPDPSRTFPAMKDVLSGTTTLGETLPTTTRLLAFRVTARDNRGGFDSGDVEINVCGHLGPFAVTHPTASTQAREGSSLTVNWDVEYTDVPPINAPNVRILLSTDNGDTFPTELASSTSNDGSFAFIVPRGSTQEARIKVEAINNIFFNVSPAFTIRSAPTITTTGSLTITKGGPEVMAQVATVADGYDEATLLSVLATTDDPTGVMLDIVNDGGIVSARATADCISHGGPHPITLRVTNSAGLTDWTTFNLVVDPNPGPTLGTYGNVNVIAGQPATVWPSVPPVDANGNLSSINVSTTTTPLSATLSANVTTGVVTISTLPSAQPGIYGIRVEAFDSCGRTATRTFFLTVSNSPPQITRNTNSVRTTPGGTSVAPVIVATVFDAQDAPGTLSVSATAPAGLTITATNSNGTVSATATATCIAPATYNATLSVTDSASANASTTFPVIVEPNPPPTLGTYFDSAVTVGGSVINVPNAPPSDPNNPAVPVAVSVNPMILPGGGQVIPFANGRVVVNTVAGTTLGTYQIFVTGRDACGAQTTSSFRLTVRSASCVIEQSLVFAADTGNHRIQRFTGNNWQVIGSGTQGSGLGQFTSPESVVASPNGQRIYVADTGNMRIQWSQNGGVTWAVFASGLIPQGLVLDRDGNLYVSDSRDSLVTRYRSGVPGSPIVLASSGSGSGRVSNPNGLAIDCRMNLYVADTGNNRVLMIVTADSTMVPNTGTVMAGSGAGLNPAQVTAPQGLAVDNTGKLYVADTGNNRVLTIVSAPSPGAATELCTLGGALGQVRGPEGVTIAAFTFGQLAGVSSISVSDTNNNRIEARALPAGPWMLGVGQFKLPSKIR